MRAVLLALLRRRRAARLVAYPALVGADLQDREVELEVGAARQVFGAPDLAAAVESLCAPDVAAQMALAGWQLVTEGAAITDALIEEIQAALDEQDTRPTQGRDNARA